MNRPAPALPPSGGGQLPEMELVVEKFTQAWRACLARPGQIPDLGEFAAGDAGKRCALLLSLIPIDLEFRWKLQAEQDQATVTQDESHDSERGALRGSPLVEDYCRRFPELGPLEKLPLSLVVAEYRSRLSQRIPDLRAEYSARFPGLGSDLRAALDRVDAESSLTQAKGDAPRTDPPSQAGLPERVGRFEIVELLGEGAFGKVYRGRDPELHRMVAIKVPHDGVLKTPQDRERFLREARAAAGLSHPNLCPVYEAGTADGRHYIVMALIEGRTLSQILQSGKPLSQRNAANAVRKLALALAEAHAHGVIHRDLKPGNILVNARGEPIVTDFGLAVSNWAGDARLTHSGAVVGTPAYMSPEQASGVCAKLGPESDVYSLGVVLYELLTGKRPYVGSVAVVLGQILHVAPPAPSVHRPDLDPRLERIVLQAMAKEPTARFHSMAAFAEALTGYLRETSAASGNSAPSLPTSAAPALSPTPLPNTLSAPGDAGGNSFWRTWRGGAAAAAVALSVLVLAGTLLFQRSDGVTIVVNVPLDTRDPALTFLLDDVEISAEALSAPLVLAPGEHELVVKRDQQLFRVFRFSVGHAQSGPVAVQDATPPEILQSAGTHQRIRLLVPAYFYPAGDGQQEWERLLAAAAEIDLIAVANSDSGPGPRANPDYARVIQRCADAGVQTAGYVSTQYGQRPLEEVQADIDRWFDYYPSVGGVFLDEQASGVAQLDYYRAAAEHARKRSSSAIVISNPGTICAPEYMEAGFADVVCLSEDHGDMGVPVLSNVAPSASAHVGALVYGVADAAEMRSVLDQLAAQGIGAFYITDGVQPNPWLKLPPWWDEEVHAAGQASAASP